MSFSLKSPVVVTGGSLHQVHFGPRDAAYGPVPVVSYTHVEVSGVKVLEILVERHKVLHMDESREHNEGRGRKGVHYLSGRENVRISATRALGKLSWKEFTLWKYNL